MSNELIAGLIGAIVGGSITAFSSFFLSFYDKKSNLIMERSKAYKKIRSLWIEIWIDLAFRTSQEYSSVGSSDKEKYIDGIYKKTSQVMDVMDEGLGLVSEEMTYLNHKLYLICDSVLGGMVRNDPLLEFQNKIKQGTEAREKMMELYNVECYLERSILNDGFIKFLNAVIFEKRLKIWKIKNKKAEFTE